MAIRVDNIALVHVINYFITNESVVRIVVICVIELILYS